MNQVYSLLRRTAAAVMLLTATVLPSSAQIVINCGQIQDNGSSMITFNFTNSNADPIQITDISSWTGSSAANAATLWYNTTPISASPTPINAGTGWTAIGPQAFTVPAGSIQPMMSNIGLVIPAGATYGIAFSLNTSLQYKSNPTTTTYSNGGCTVTMGPNIGWGGTLTSAINDRGFVGNITFIPLAVCSGTPTPGTISGPPVICAGTGTTLNLNGATLGTGVSYDWQSSATSGGPYTSVGSGFFHNTGPLAATTYYVATTTCTLSGQSATTPEFTLPVTGPSAGGTFTIDNTLPTGGTNFNSFTDAITTLNTLGQCGAFTGPVVFNVAAGQVFNEYPPAITASGSGTNTITFQRAGVGANPVLVAAGTTAGNEGALAVNGGDFFTFDGIDVQAGNNLLEFGYVLRNASTTNGASNNTIRNCSITMDRTLTTSIALLHSSGSTGGGFTPTSAAGQNDNCLYENISISNSANGIYLFSGSTVYVGVNNQVVGCTVGAPFLGLPTPDIGNPTIFVTTTGINMNNQTDCVVRDNVVQNIGSFGGTNRGIWIQNGRGTCSIYNNRVRGVRNTSPTSVGIQRGMEVNGATTGTHVLRVYNNQVSGMSAAYINAATSTRILSGIFLGSGSVGVTYNVDFNSVSVDASGSPTVSSACLEFGGNTATHNVRNNSLANLTGPQTGAAIHLVMRATSATIIANAASVINYNNLYVANAANGFIAQGATTNWANIAAYDGAVITPASNDANSVSADPQYTDPAGNPTANATALNGAGDITGITWVTTDINNALRSAPHDIGANNIDGCAGTINPGNTIASAVSICPSTTAFFSIQNSTPGFGVTYLWEESVDGITYGPAAGTNTNSTYSAVWTAPLYIRCQVTCSGFSTETSTPVQVLLNSFLDCYCTSTATSTADEEILNVTFNSLNNNSACGDLAPGAGSVSNMYGNYKGLTPTVVQQFLSYPLSLTLGTCGGNYGRTAKVFIDWNQNGLLTDPGEEVTTVTYQSTTGNPQVFATNVLVPGIAVPGNTLMRVVYVETTGAVFPCGTYTWGETEDYLINVTPGVPCIDPPVPGTVAVANTAVCSGDLVTFTHTGGTVGGGQTYQWESSVDGVAFTPILGETTTLLSTVVTAPLYYRLAITCGSTSYSNVVQMSLNPFYACYCSFNLHTFSSPCITNVTMGTLNNTSVATCAVPAYTVYFPPAPNQTTNLQLSSPYSLTMTHTGFVYSWLYFDWNQDGDFDDAGEQFLPTTGNTSTANSHTFTFSVPVTATLGLTGMRVRTRTSNTPGACLSFTAGETENYVVTIDPAPPCPTPGAPTLVLANASSAQVTWNCPICPGTYYVEYGPQGFVPGTGSTIGGGLGLIGPVAGGPVSFAGLTGQTAYQVYLREDCGVLGQSSNSVPLSFTTPPGCGSAWYDNGGLAGVYANNSNDVTVICPDSPGDLVTVSFSAFQTESGWDPLYVFDGPNVGSPQIASTNGVPSGNNVYGTGGWWGAVPPGPFTSSHATGCLTLAFTSDASVQQAGWTASITCSPAPACTIPGGVAVTGVSGSQATASWLCAACTGTFVVEYGPIGFTPGTDNTPGVGGTVILNAVSPQLITGLSSGTGYSVYVRQNCDGLGTAFSPNNFTVATFTTSPGCGDAWYDLGGPGGLYPNNANNVETFCPDTPGETVIISFSAFQTETGWDPLYVFNGPTTASPKIASTNGVPSGNNVYGTGGWWGTVPPGPFISSDPSGCLTMAFTSDGSVQQAGWTASVNCVTPNLTCATAKSISCGSLNFGYTLGGTNNLPPTACSFNGAASTGGVSWWSYSAGATEDVTLSTCGLSTMNTRISVFQAMPDCSNLVCIAQGDDVTGCGNGTTEMTFPAQSGMLYYVAVHGTGATNGTFQLAVTCSPSCTPSVANDRCPNATAVIPVPADGTGVASTQDNGCAYGDAPTSCSGATPVQGVWYTFNTGVNSRMIINLLDFDINPIYSAPNLSYALYSGACVGNGAAVEVSCVSSADGTTVTPVLNQGADYSLLVYNQGGIGLEGTFGLLIEKPLLNDAGITSVDQPTGLVCGTVVNPVVTVRNYGENTLTSVNIDIAIDGGAPIFTYVWTGSIPFGQSAQVTLPDVVIPSGQHIMNATTSLPNGVPDELASNDAGSGSYDQSGEAVTLAIQTDNWPQETTWEIYDAFFFPVANGGPYPGQNNSLILEQLCLSTDFGNCYSLYLYDSFGDGICCGFGIGYWELQNPSGEVLLRDIFHGSGTYPGSTDIGGAVTPTTTPLSASYTGHDFCLPTGPSNILSSECGITTNTLQSKVYCQPVAGATSYQFEFLNPDAGFRRRIVVTGRTWVKFSEMVTVPLVPGTTYFAHVRADRNTPGFEDDNFGAGCEMALDATQVPGCTQLLDDTALPTHSCGVSKLFGAGDKVYALPIVGATQYRFKFENAGEGFVRVITRPNYILLLNWTTLPLQVGVTYSVKVEVLVNGIWSGYCGNACSVTIGAPAASGTANRDVAVTSDNGDMLQIWPNPVRDGQVNLLLNNLVDAEQRISVDVIDLFGKRVHSQQFNNSGDVFNTVLELDGLASGVYVVNLTVNDRIMTERITVQ